MKIVLDTNVLVLALLTPFGAPGEILQLIVSSQVALCVDARILIEYEEVLLRPRFKFDANNVVALMDFLRATAVAYPAAPLAKRLPDEDDEPFLEVAMAARADRLVTGNLRHFPRKLRAGVRVLSPAEFMDFFKKG